MYDTAILIGRFQPVHRGHLALLTEALAVAHRAVVVLGSAHAARSPRNPFTWQERAAMLQGALAPEQRARVHLVAVRDYYNEPVWAQAVVRAVHALLQRTDGSPPAAGSICLVGHFKDASSGYLHSFPAWPLQALPRQNSTDATVLREAWLGGAAPASLAGELPASAVQFLESFAKTPAFAALQDDGQALRGIRDTWASAPPAALRTSAHAVLQAHGQLLLAQRTQAPGRGQWELPGGALQPHETLAECRLRALRELGLPADVLGAVQAAAPAAARVFDHPARTPAVRTVAHVQVLDLTEHLAPPHAGPCTAAGSAHWAALHGLLEAEDRFADDHFHMVDSCLGLLPPP